MKAISADVPAVPSESEKIMISTTTTMITTEEIERLIAVKKRDILEEKVLLGLVPDNNTNTTEQKCDETNQKQVKFKDIETTTEAFKKHDVEVKHNAVDRREEIGLYDLEEPEISADLERYIRRYIGLPGMLKAGEFSPNNPLIRGERVTGICGDAFLGLGEYERRRNTLRKIRQAQYREFLDRQAQKKQEAKEEAERERREQEEKEREREERERQLLLERDRYSPERRVSVSVPYQYASAQKNKVDTAVQVDAVSSPLSVAVQTDGPELYRLSHSPTNLTEAERELSPRTVGELSPRTVGEPKHAWDKWDERRRSYGDFDERTSTIRKSNREKLHSDLRHSVMPSIFDADAIQMRNELVQKEAAERRQFYQQELKNQIMEQQRIREERKSREKLLEQAEMRRLEEQLRMLRAAQEKEIGAQHDLTAAIKNNARDYETKRADLQRDIDTETQKLRAASHPTRNLPKRTTNTSRSDTQKLPHFEKSYQSEKSFQPIKKPYSMNIPDNSLFSPNYDVDSYLRKNLNFKNKIELRKDSAAKSSTAESKISEEKQDQRFTVEALVHEPKKIENNTVKTKPSTLVYDVDSLSVPILRHSPNKTTEAVSNIEVNRQVGKSMPVLRNSPKKPTETGENLSEAMKKVEDKWKVPAVQKNILKSLPNEGNASILTQLGSIRRQLQLEQLKLDKMLNKV